MWLMSPLSWLLIGAALCCLGGNAPRSGRMRRAGLALVAVAAVAMTPLVANGLMGWLEAKRPLPEACTATPPTVAVVLAESADQPVHGQQDVFALSVTSRRRVEHAVSGWQTGHGRRLIMAGGPHEPGGVMHMPRAQYAMERAGFRVCALPADQRRVAIGWPGYMVPRTGALAKTESALHELMGIVYYRWLHKRNARTQAGAVGGAATGQVSAWNAGTGRA